MNKKRVWIYIVVIAVVILSYILINNIRSQKQIQITTLAIANNNPPLNNTVPSAPENINMTKNNYTALYALDWQTSSLDDPNDFVFMYIPGNYNSINVSSRTEVARVTFTGTRNKVTFCTGNYPQPEIIKVGVNNQVSYVVC